MKIFSISPIFKLITIVLFFVVANINAQETKAQETKKIQTDAKPPVKFEISSYDWHGEIPESRLVVLKNYYGDIRSRNHSDQEIFLHANYQLIGENGIKPEFKISEEQNHLVIEVVYAESILDSNNQLRGRTDVSILFPDDVSIYAETNQGMIKIDKTASHVQAVSQSGDIKLTTTGLFSVKTNSGNISLRLRGQKELGESTVYSQSGIIKADIFNDMGLHLTTKTSGHITLNDKPQKNEFIFEQLDKLSLMKFQSVSGDIQLQVISPPDLVDSVKPSNPTSVDVDLRDIKKSKPWKPGDPIIDINEKKLLIKQN